MDVAEKIEKDSKYWCENEGLDYASEKIQKIINKTISFALELEGWFGIPKTILYYDNTSAICYEGFADRNLLINISVDSTCDLYCKLNGYEIKYSFSPTVRNMKTLVTWIAEHEHCPRID